MKQIKKCYKYVYCLKQIIAILNSIINMYVSFIKDAFSLLAYSNPWDSPVGWQLEATQRDSVCAALNSAILGN